MSLLQAHPATGLRSCGGVLAGRPAGSRSPDRQGGRGLESVERTAWKRLAAAGFWLGFALSGFFDGILLHQILQWHHLLSGLEGETVSDLRFQVLADGYFHIAMYGVAAVALVLLWRARGTFDMAGAGKRLIAWLLIGFGAWHFVDAVGSHWVMQIHRIRMDAESPLLWDVGWLLTFGVAPLAAGLWLKRGGGGGARPMASRTLAGLLAVVTPGLGVWAAQAPPGQDYTTIVFAPYVPADAALSAAASVSDAIWWVDDAGGVVVVSGLHEGRALSLYGQGALLVTGVGVPPGCVTWSRV